MHTPYSYYASRFIFPAKIIAIVICVLFVSKTTFAQPFEGNSNFILNGNIVTYNRNTFELEPPKMDTVEVADHKTGKQFLRVIQTDNYKPAKMNGSKVYSSRDVDEKPAFLTDKKTKISAYIFDFILKNMDKLMLADGEYLIRLEGVLIGPGGKLEYYCYSGIETKDNKQLPKNYHDFMDDKINIFMLRFPQLIPAKKAGQNVPCVLADVSNRMVIVKDHKATLITEIYK